MFDKDVLLIIADMNTTVMWIAITVGLLLFIIGYFAGGSLTKGRILLCTAMVTTIGILGLKVPIAVYTIVEKQFDLVTVPYYSNTTTPSENETNGVSKEANDVPITFQLLTLLIYTLWTGYLIAMGIFFYETLVVTAEEIDKK